MSSPINISQSVMQSVLSERVQQVQQQHPDMQQRYFEHQLTQEAIRKQNRVNEFEDLDYIKLRDKQHRKQQRDQQKAAPDCEKGPAETTAGSEHPGKIDVKV